MYQLRILHALNLHLKDIVCFVLVGNSNPECLSMRNQCTFHACDLDLSGPVSFLDGEDQRWSPGLA